MPVARHIIFGFLNHLKHNFVKRYFEGLIKHFHLNNESSIMPLILYVLAKQDHEGGGHPGPHIKAAILIGVGP